MKILLKLLLLAVIGLPVAALAAVWMCFQDAPLIARKADISPSDIERAKRIVETYDPRKARPGTLRGIGAPAYQRMMADIERRVGSVAVFR